MTIGLRSWLDERPVAGQSDAKAFEKPIILDRPHWARLKSNLGFKWCPETDLNRRHADFQSAALPTELSGQLVFLGHP